jgi:hypothetical protein
VCAPKRHTQSAVSVRSGRWRATRSEARLCKGTRTGQMIGERQSGMEIVSAAIHGASAQVYTPKPSVRRTRVCGKEGLGDRHRGLRQFCGNAKSADFRRLESHAVLCFQAVTSNSNQQHRRLETGLTPAKSPRTPFPAVAKVAGRFSETFYSDFPRTSNATLTKR